MSAGEVALFIGLLGASWLLMGAVFTWFETRGEKK